MLTRKVLYCDGRRTTNPELIEDFEDEFEQWVFYWSLIMEQSVITLH
jgi:hypothetical protein